MAQQDELVPIEALPEEAADPSFFAGVFVGLVVVGLIFTFT